VPLDSAALENDISGHCTIHREAASAEKLANINARMEQYAEKR
jgi:hypothetical protein